MISPILIQRRQRRYKAKKLPPPGAPLVLLSAIAGTVTATLTFDREVDLTGAVATAFSVDDPSTSNQQYLGTGTVTQISAGVVRVHLTANGPAVGTVPTLTVTAGNGIVASDDGGTWGGVTGLGLPFGE